MAATGFLSHVAYEPDLRGNAIVPVDARPAADVRLADAARRGCTRLNQGLHVNVGLVAIPFLLAKLWSVIPRLFVVAAGQRRRRQGIERLAIALLVASAIFQFATGDRERAVLVRRSTSTSSSRTTTARSCSSPRWCCT